VRRQVSLGRAHIPWGRRQQTRTTFWWTTLEEETRQCSWYAVVRPTNHLSLAPKIEHGHSQRLAFVSPSSPEPRVGHVVPIPDVADLEALKPPLLLDDRHDVGHDLARVVVVGEAIDDWHARVLWMMVCGR